MKTAMNTNNRDGRYEDSNELMTDTDGELITDTDGMKTAMN